MTSAGYSIDYLPGPEGKLILLAAVLERFRIQRAGELAVHVVENVGDGVFGEAFKTGIGGPAQMGRDDYVVELGDRMILRQRFFDKDIEGGAGDYSLLQYFYQHRVIDNRAAGRVDRSDGKLKLISTGKSLAAQSASCEVTSLLDVQLLSC